MALDVGRGAAGARFTGAWLGVGRAMGLSQYTSELWVDFGADRVLHPLLGAGGGVARLEVPGTAGELDTTTVGIGTLRAALQYSLPVRATPARAGLEAVGCVPAVQSPNTPRIDPWVVATATVTVGF